MPNQLSRRGLRILRRTRQLTRRNTPTACVIVASVNALSILLAPGVGNADASVTIPVSLRPPAAVVADRTPATPLTSASRAPIVRDVLGRWLVPFTRASLPTSYELRTQSEPIELDIPVPAGLRLVELRGVFEPRDAGAGATLEVGSSARTFAVESPTGNRSSFALPLNGLASASKSSSVLGLTLDVASGSVPSIDPGTRCRVVMLDPAEVDDLVLVYAGTPVAPQSIADFLPPVLDRVIIETDEVLSTGVAEAALSLTATLVSQYPDQSVQLDVVATDASVPPPSLEPFTRTIRLLTGPSNTVRLIDGGRVLELSGSKSGLSSSVSFIGSSAVGTAFTKEMVLSERPEKGVEPRDRQPVTLDKLRRNLAALGTTEARFALTARQSDLGGPTYRASLRMKGRVVSVEGDARKVAVRLTANGLPLDSQELAVGDGFVLEGSIEPEAMRRDNEIVIETNVIATDNQAPGNRCGVPTSIRLELDPDSVLVSEPGNAVPAGFDRFPAAFHRGVSVSLSPIEVDQLSSAVRIVAALQERTLGALNPTVRTWPTEPIKTPSILIGGTTQQLMRLQPPLLPGSLGVDLATVEVKAATKPKPVTALQAFESKKGSDVILLTTSDHSSQLVSVADQVRTMDEGWNELRGDVYLVADGQARFIRLRKAAEVPVAFPGRADQVASLSARNALQTGSLIALLGLGTWAGIGYVIRRVRRR
jgi:hypothetical protein